MRPHSLRVTLLFSLVFWSAALSVGVLSLTPVQHLPPQVFDIWDKAQHAAGFAVLAILGRLAYPRQPIVLVLGLLGYGVAIELAQSATGWRYGDMQDWFADAIGVLTGWALSAAWSASPRKTDIDAQ
jgi:VanZ family protein